MKILKVLSRLIDYPQEEMLEYKSELLDVICEEENLSFSTKAALVAFVGVRFEMDLMDWQAEYDALFERGRSLSLLLFEHLHGESRDRGQAMVNLMEQYKAAGLNIDVRELPDYIPLFLEFISTQGEENAKSWLQDIAHVLSLLTVRLQKRDCDYVALFSALLELSGAEVDLTDIAEQLKHEKRDDTQKAMDKVWEEEAVTFGGDAVNGGCPSNQYRPSDNQRKDQNIPIHFVDAAAPSASTRVQ